uniref:DUF1758 domain-containing protein n=1 Tax=Heterorhabditis bacteriophora TaxID=37862 RepID=A0A1I7WUR4_HETBA
MNCKSNTQPTSSSRAVTSDSEPIQLNITHSTDKSKKIVFKRFCISSMIFGNVDIPKTNLLQLGETSIDLFTQSIDELLSGEVVTSGANNIKNSNGKNIILSEYDEVDDLETSLLRVSLGKIANNEDNSSEKFSQVVVFSSLIIVQVNLCKEFVEDLEDSFDHPISVPNTPSTVSPLGKCSRLTAMPSKVSVISVPYFTINDVCRNETAWNHFVQRSSIWKLVGLSLAFSPLGTTVDGIVFCTPDSNPDFISLSQEYFPGNSCEESLCPSSTPSQSIPISDRLSAISHILSSCQVYMGNALKDSLTLWESFKIMVSRPVCISYLSFLSHIKCGDSVPTISQIATEFEWNFDVQAFLLMNPRIRTAVQAFIYSRLVKKLPTLVINMSSAKSFNLEFGIIKARPTLESLGVVYTYMYYFF